METLKNLYNELNNTKNKNVKNTVIFSTFLCILLISSAIYIFRNFNKSRLFVPNDQSHRVRYAVPQKQIVRNQLPRRPINKSPEKRGGYLIRRKPGYVEQSPKKKSYPTKFKISSILD